MTNAQYTLFTLALPMLLVSCVRQEGLRVGERLPRQLARAVTLRDRMPTVLVILDGRSCLGCETPASYLRRALRNPAIHLRIVAISGDARDSLISGFLQDQRLPAPTLALTPSQASELTVAAKLPAFIVVSADTIAGIGALSTLRPELVALALESDTSSPITVTPNAGAKRHVSAANIQR